MNLIIPYSDCYREGGPPKTLVTKEASTFNPQEIPNDADPAT